MASIDITNMQPDYTSFTDVFTGVKILGNMGLMSAFISVIVMLLISRNVGTWGIMWFPVLMLLKLIGFPVTGVMLAVSILVFIASIWKRAFGVSILVAARKKIMSNEREEIAMLSERKRRLKLEGYQKPKQNKLLTQAKMRLGLGARDSRVISLSNRTKAEMEKKKKERELKRWFKGV